MFRLGSTGGCPNIGTHKSEWCWGCYENKKGKSNWKGHKGYRAPRAIKPLHWSQIVKRPANQTETEKATGAPDDAGFMKLYPTIWEYMTHDKYDDGGARERSTLKIRVTEGQWLMALNDEENRQSVYTQGNTMADTLKALEKGLRDGTAVFRPWGNQKKKK